MEVEKTKTAEEFLAHYGVLGMKWGVRKDRRYMDRFNYKSTIVTNTIPKVDDITMDNSGAPALITKVKEASPEAVKNIETQMGRSLGPTESAYEITTVNVEQRENMKKSNRNFRVAAVGSVIASRAIQAVLAQDDLERDDDQTAYEAERAEEFLAHYGVLGMKWGVRKDRFNSKSTIVTNTIPKVDDTTLDNSGAPALITKVKEASPEAVKNIETQMGRSLGPTESAYEITTVNVEQRENMKKSNRNFRVAVAGSFIATKAIQAVLAQDDLDGDDDQTAYEAERAEEFLAHYGVLGMKWGVRRSQTELAGDSGKPVPVRDLQGNKIVQRDGKYQRKDGATRSVDAVKARTSQTKARAYGTDSLSNEDIDALIKRLDLEKKYSQITAPQKNGNSKKVRNILKNFVNDNAKYAANTLAKREINKVLKVQTKK